MASSNSNPESREHRALHAVIALCLLIVAQLNILLRPEPLPAKTIPAPESERKSAAVAVGQKEAPPIAESTTTSQPAIVTVATISTAMEKKQAIDIPEPVKLEETAQTHPEPVSDKPPTAFELVREGNQHLSERSQGKVVQIISNRSHDGVTPTSWRVIYYDSRARFKAVEVRFEGREVTRVFEPGRFLQLFSERAHEPIDPDWLNVDSDQALRIAVAELGENDTKVTDSEMALETGSDGIPVWKINLWGGVKHDYRLGEVVLSAVDGTVLKNRLKTMPSRTASLSQSDSKVFLQKRL